LGIKTNKTQEKSSKFETTARLYKRDVVRKIIEESPVKVTVPVAEKASYQHEKMKEISNKISNEELIVEFLEKTEKTFSAVGFDIKNIIEIMKMEQL
jgi:hypothetical protein